MLSAEAVKSQEMKPVDCTCNGLKSPVKLRQNLCVLPWLHMKLLFTVQILLQCALPPHTHTHTINTHIPTHTTHTHTHTFRQVTQSKRLAEEEAKPPPHKDYSLKAGEKIHINLGVRTCSQIIWVAILALTM